ncbi:glycoside-pentoside-hexuronide (GPH):cation symporter [Georgenia subflava]|uniref:MFS transporter n=1 Tax=Georgenia subflava TaxID=1622177 RepID=A0A6N7EIR0_9MICO|nr:glycoside-pentoside-hexuronide (GPH):cation symporter [Georgenia subflava]MPV36898.1 MFS transporter [Georgenia subflava]
MTATQAPAAPAAAPPKKLGLGAYLGYAAGDAGNNLAFTMASMFLLLYYTDVVGIPAAYAAPIFLIVRIWDGIGDVIVGRWVDRTSTRWGKFRPWILWSSLPLLLSSVWVFSLPQADSLTMKLFWAYLSYGVLAMLYSMVNIPYGSLAAAMTQVPTERAKLATFRSVGAAATGLVLALVVAPQVQRWSSTSLYEAKVEALGGEAAATQAQLDAAKAAAVAEASTGLQGALTTITLIFVFVGMALYLTTFFTAKEQVARPAQDKATLREAVDTLRKNKPLIWLCVGSLLFLTSFIAFSTMGIYYARDVLGNGSLFAVFTIVQTGAIFVLAPFIAKIVGRFGKRTGYLGGAVAFIVGALLLFVTPASAPWMAVVGYFLVGVGLGLVNTLMWAMEADTIEYGEWKTGRRTEGTTYAVFSFIRKLGQAFGGAGAAGIIGFTGYVGTAAIQTDEALQGIRVATGLVPAALALLTLVVMWKYPLTDKRFKEITAETEARKAAEAADAAH